MEDEFNRDCFVPGIVQQVQCTPQMHKGNHKFYLILYFNGQTGINKGSELVKITKHNYGLYVDHIMINLNMLE